jgi:hypothetical protein
MFSIKVILNRFSLFLFCIFRDVKRDNRSVFLYAYENTEAFLSLELQVFFSSAERRVAYVSIKINKFI